MLIYTSNYSSLQEEKIYKKISGEYSVLQLNWAAYKMPNRDVFMYSLVSSAELNSLFCFSVTV